MNDLAPSRTLSVAVVRHMLLLPTVGFAALTVLTQASRILDVRFRTYAMACAVALVLLGALWAYLWRWERKAVTVYDRKTVAVLLALGLIGAALASIYHLPDSDDYMLTPQAVHYITYPDDILSNQIHYLVPAGPTINSVVVSTSFPFEYAQALGAWMLGIPFLDIYYVVAVAVVGFAVPLALFLLISHFARDSRRAALAALFTILVVTLLGETKYSPGSLSLTRLFQGKAVLLTAGLPFFAALSFDYLEEGGIRRWFLVATAATALSGLSSTAFFAVPMTALALGVAHSLAVRVSWAGLGRLASYGVGLIYPVVYGLYASGSVGRFQDPSSSLVVGWSADFGEQFRLLIDPGRPVTLLVAAAGLAGTAVLFRGMRRRLLLLWSGAVIVLLLNPIVAPFWIAHVTGPVLYWRVFHLFPLEALVGAVAVGFLEILPVRRGLSVLVVSSAVVGLACLHLVPGSTSIFRRGGAIGWPAYNLRSGALAAARRVAEVAPPGPMLAPPDVAGTIGMITGGYPQVHLREEPIRMWLPWDQAEQRYAAARFADGDPGAQSAFESVVQTLPGLEVVVLRTSVLSKVGTFLEGEGFGRHTVVGEYSVLWK